MSEPPPASTPEPERTPATGTAERFARLPRRTQLVAVALLGLALLAGLQALLAKDYREAAYLESYGSLVASQLARLGQDAMVREDAIALNVLAEQVAAEPAIVQVEIYSMDGATLASYSSPATGVQPPKSASAASREFTRPIQLADATAGFVKVIVATEALNPPHNDYQLKDQLRFGAALALSAIILAMFIAWLTREQHKTNANAQHTADTASSRADGHAAQTHFYMILANLYNGNDMPISRRNALMGTARNNTNAVAALYQGTVQQVSPTAFAMLFGEVNTPERSFQIACAALVLARLGNQPGGGRYRYSLQRLQLPDGPASLLDPAAGDVREDAQLHAALAEDNAVALSANFARELPRSERLELTSEHSPALAALHAGDTLDYFLMSGAKPTTEAMLAKQVEALRAPAS